MKNALFVCLACFTVSSFGQELKVVVKDKSDKVLYPTIVVLNQKYSFNADKDGLFSFQNGIVYSDSLLILKQGFYPLKTTVEETKNRELIELIGKPPEHAKGPKLPAAVKKTTLNPFEKNKVFFYIGMEKPTEHFNYLQAAQKFEISKKAVINKVSIRRLILDDQGFLTDPKLLTRTRFLLRIYNEDENGKPGADLCSESIEVTDLKSEVIKVDLKKYSVYTGGNFFVAIEWLRVPYNGQATLIGDDGNILSVTPKSTSKLRIYQPFIGMSNTVNEKSNSWILTYDNQWKPYNYFAPQLSDFAISADVSYLESNN